MAIKLASRSECHCSDPSTMLFEKKRISHVTALLLMSLFCAFVGGYFLGKRAASQELFEQLQDETLAHHIHHSLHTFYKPLQSDEEEIKVVEEPSMVADTHIEDHLSNPPVPVVDQQEMPVPSVSSAGYIAYLFGGTLQDSQKCVNQLRARGIETRIIKRSSKRANNAVVYWYQVVTERHTDRQELEGLVANIKKIVKLHDIKIVTV